MMKEYAIESGHSVKDALVKLMFSKEATWQQYVCTKVKIERSP